MRKCRSTYEKIPFENAFGTIVTERVIDLLILICFVLLALFIQYDLILNIINEKKISFGHARALLNSPNQLDLAHKVIKDNMSVRELEDFLREGQHKDKNNNPIKKSLNLKDANIVDYEKYLSLKLGYKVEIKDKEGKGYLIVRYKNLEQLDAIIDLLNN